MPTIEQFHSQQGVLPANPGEATIHPASYGQEGTALAGVGEQISKIGGEWLDSVTRASDADANMNAKQQVMTQMASKEDSIRSQYSKIDPDTGVVTFDPRGAPETDDQGNTSYPNSYSKTVTKAWQDAYQDSLSTLPSARARQEYTGFMGSVVAAKGVQATNFENQQLAKYFEDNRANIAEKGKQNLYNKPDLTTFAIQATALKQYDEANAGVLLKSENAVEKHNEMMRDVVNNGLMRGYLDKDPQAGLDMLNSTASDPAHPMADPSLVKRYMDKGDVAHWTEQFKSQINQNDHAQAVQLNSKLTDMQAAAQAGKYTGGSAGVKQIIDKMDGLGYFASPEDKVRRYGDAMTDVLVNNYRVHMNGMNADQLNAAANSSEGQLKALIKDYSMKEGADYYPELGARGVEQMRSKIQAVANTMNKQLDKEPAQAALERLPAIQKLAAQVDGGMSTLTSANENYFATSMAEQKRLGASEALPFTPAQVQDISTKLKGASGQQSALVLQDLQSKTGKYFPDVMRQLVRDAKVPDYYVTASYTDDPQASAAIINDLRAKKTFDKVLEENRQGYNVGNVKKSVNESFAPFEQAMVTGDTTGNNQKVANGLREATLYQTANLISQGVDAKEAAQRATNTIIGNKYQVYQGALLPNDNAEKIKSAMGFAVSNDFLNMHGDKIDLPRSPGLDKLNADGTPTIETQLQKTKLLKDKFNDPNNYAWVTNSDQSGAVLNMKVPDSRFPMGYKMLPMNIQDRTGQKVPLTVDFKTAQIKGN